MRSTLVGGLLFCSLLLLSACASTTSSVDCTPGTENCECKLGDACNDGLNCVDGVCQPGDEPSDGDADCPVGSENCPCYSNQTCDFNLSCEAGACVYTGNTCQQGSVGCSCYPNDTCDADLICTSGVCTDPNTDGDEDSDDTDGDADGDDTDGDADTDADGDADADTDGDEDGDDTDGDVIDGDDTDGDEDGDDTDGDEDDDDDGDLECAPVVSSDTCDVRSESWCQARHWEPNCSDTQCLGFGWQYGCNDDGYCTDYCSVDYGNVDYYPSLTDWTGTWGSVSTMAIRTTGLPSVAGFDSVMIHHTLDRLSVSETGKIIRSSKICSMALKNFNGDTIVDDDFLQFSYPPAFAESLGTLTQQIVNAPAFQAGNTFTTDRHWEVRGAVLTDLASEALPTRQDYLTADSRIWDQDVDAHPAMTIWLRGIVNYDYYIIQRVSSVMEGTIEDGNRMVGLNDFTFEQEVLAANNDSGLYVLTINPHADADRSYYRMARLPDDATCADVLQLSQQQGNWLEFTPHMDPDYVAEDGDADGDLPEPGELGGACELDAVNPDAGDCETGLECVGAYADENVESPITCSGDADCDTAFGPRGVCEDGFCGVSWCTDYCSGDDDCGELGGDACCGSVGGYNMCIVPKQCEDRAEVKLCNMLSYNNFEVESLCLEIDGKVLQTGSENCSVCETITAYQWLDFVMSDCHDLVIFTASLDHALNPAYHYVFALVPDGENQVTLTMFSVSGGPAGCDQISYQDVLDQLGRKDSGVEIVAEFPVALP